MINPYEVLGLTPQASDDEIKKAYRTLSRKYHPDANINNPNKALAEEKFKEVQAAYNQIIDERQHGGGYQDGYSSYSSSYSSSGSDSSQLFAAANFINNRRFAEALNVLNSVPEMERTGKWYFFSAVASQGLGNINAAREYISRAIALEPGNIQYRQFFQNLNFGSGWYTTQMHSYGYQRPYAGVSKWCFNMLLLNLLCNCFCCGGPLRF